MSEKSADLRLDGMQVTVLVLIWIVLMPFMVWLRAIVMHSCWDWFIIPLGASSVTAVHCYGLSLCVSLLHAPPPNQAEKTFSAHMASIVMWPIVPLITWAFAYGIHLWM